MADYNAPQTLDQAIAAINAKQWQQARDILANLLTKEPNNAQAWLWFSATLSNPYDQERCLNRVLEIQPESTLAIQGLTVTRQKIAETLFERAQQAINFDDRVVARESLLELVERDETHLEGWELLCTLVDSTEEQEICLDNILTLDPDNQQAQESLALLQQARIEADVDPTVEVETTEYAEEERVASTLAGDVLGVDYREKYTTVIIDPEPEQEPISEILWREKFIEPLHCPYCLVPTSYDDKRCPSCNNALWERRLVNPERSTKLTLVTLFQTFNAGMLLVAPILAILVVGIILRLPNPSSLLGTYFGRTTELSADIIDAAHTKLPPILVYIGWIPALFAGALAFAIHLRWRPVFFFLLANAIIGLISSIIALGRFSVSEYPLLFAGGLVSLVISIGFAIFILNMENDFAYRRFRFQLEVDPDLNDSMACLKRGNVYARLKMWGKAAVHYRKATALAPKITNGYRALAEACIQLREWEIAKAALETARTLAPNDERITKRLSQVETKLTTAV